MSEEAPVRWVPLPGGAWVAVDDCAWKLARNAHPLDDELTPRRSLALFATAPRQRYQAQRAQPPDAFARLSWYIVHLT